MIRCVSCWAHLFSVKEIVHTLLDMLDMLETLHTLPCVCKSAARLFASWNNSHLLFDWAYNLETLATPLIPAYNLNLMKAGQRLVNMYTNTKAIVASDSCQGSAQWVPYKDRSIMTAAAVAENRPEGAIIIQRDYRKSSGKIVKNFQIATLDDYLARKLATGRTERPDFPHVGQHDNHLYHDVEDGMLLKPILDIDGNAKQTGFHTSEDPEFKDCVASIRDKLCSYLSKHCSSSKHQLLAWTSVHFSTGSKASCHMHILKGAFGKDVGTLRAHMKQFEQCLCVKEKLITDLKGCARVGAFRDTGMTKLPAQSSQELRYLREDPDPELSGYRAIRLYGYCRPAYELLIIPTLVCPRDAVSGTQISPLQEWPLQPRNMPKSKAAHPPPQPQAAAHTAMVG